MKTSKWLTYAINKLNAAGIATARLDCLILLEDATGKDRAWLLAHPEFPINARTMNKLNSLIKRRASHEPLAYIRGKSEFYGRTFIVNQHTLEPRPESETMIELFKKLIYEKPNAIKSVADIGTGSGCLAITAKLEVPGIHVFATDIDAFCIKAARQNAHTYNADAEIFRGDLILPVQSFITTQCALLCNLPYVPDSHTINAAAMFEPKHAIFGGLDGLDIYRRLFTQISSLAKKPVYIFTESLPFQHTSLAQIAASSKYELVTSSDFIQVFNLGTRAKRD
jgi:release factor glutamine methyltransferase